MHPAQCSLRFLEFELICSLWSSLGCAAAIGPRPGSGQVLWHLSDAFPVGNQHNVSTGGESVTRGTRRPEVQPEARPSAKAPQAGPFLPLCSLFLTCRGGACTTDTRALVNL